MLETSNEPEARMPGGDFRVFVQKLKVQGLMVLGLLDDPRWKDVPRNLDHARALIEDLEMLREKTEGNLTEDEEQELDQASEQLREHYMELREQEG
ncbi:MAG: DUF1844 domain-containing protein [Planctomycetes bacterium]|nr:DUF1844 domain-containing protein [Planctomycetota bacterium]